MLHIYRLSDGLFTGLAFDMQPRTPERIAAHTPVGCAAMELTNEQQGRVRVNVETGQLEPYETQAPSAASLAGVAVQAARDRRDSLLDASDWVVTRAAERGEAMPAAWGTYRQVLRDVTAQPGFPSDITWPTSPDNSTEESHDT